MSAAPSAHRRSADALFDPGEYEDSFIELGFPEVTRAEVRRAEAIRLAERRRVDEARLTEQRHAEAERRKTEGAGQRRSKAADRRRAEAAEQRRVEAAERRRADATEQRRAEAAEQRRAEANQRHRADAAERRQPDVAELPRAEVPEQRLARPADLRQAETADNRWADLYPAEAADLYPAEAADLHLAAAADLHPAAAAGLHPAEAAFLLRQEASGQPQAERHRPQAERHRPQAERRRPEVRATPAQRRERSRHTPALDSPRPLPDLRDTFTDNSPTAQPTTHSILKWSLYRGPATGSHRSPGTWPVESWLLIGKPRQQAMLAAVVAVGLLLFTPIQQRTGEASPVSFAERAAAAIDARRAPIKPPAVPAEHSTPARTKPAAPRATGKPHTPAKSTPPTESATTIAVPPGAGPAQSLRTTGSNVVALTFDDGPDPVETPKLLAILAQNDVKATFCLVGEQVERHPEIVRQIVAAGHTLCNHTWSHSLVIGKAKPRQIQADLQRTNDAIHAAAPDAAIPFFRAPGGNFTDQLVQTAYGDGMASLYWQVDPRDWSHPKGEDAATHVTRVIDSVRKSVRPGSIVLSHDFNQPDTIKAYEQLVPSLKEKFKLGVPKAEEPPATPTTPAEPPASSPPPSAAPEPSVSPSPDAPLSDESVPPAEPDN